MHKNYHKNNKKNKKNYINKWDILLFIIIFLIIFLLCISGMQMVKPYRLGELLPISLNPIMLPIYALRTVLRMLIALILSILFTFIVGTLAAKNHKAEQIIIPSIDILQSVPVLSILSITVTGFIRLFPGNLLGPECASIFAIFTAQVWNITFGFYQSLKLLPRNLIEVSEIFQLSAWQRFWKVEVPFSISSLLYNIIMSMSASWFFVVLSESISISHQDIKLPGIGSYIALAIENQNLLAVSYAIITMMIVIFLYDQILFKPLILWSEKFKIEQFPEKKECKSWIINCFHNSIMIKKIIYKLSILKNKIINFRFLNKTIRKTDNTIKILHKKTINIIYNILLFFLFYMGIIYLFKFICTNTKPIEILRVFMLGAITSIRVIFSIVISSIIWIPIGVYIGLRSNLTQKIQPIIQFIAAVPANLFYPLFAIIIIYLHLNSEIWLTFLMLLGTQWYILFNIITGTSRIPKDIYLVAENFNVKGWKWWIRLALPGIFPFYVTGAITAAGGAWNASIVAEYVIWGNTTLKATGLGEYIQESTISGNFSKIILGTTVMCFYVLSFNHLVWRPLYKLAKERCSFN